MTKAKSKAVTIEAWEIKVEKGKDFLPLHLPHKILSLKNRCGYCEKYLDRNINKHITSYKEFCIRCPLVKIDKSCLYSTSLYQKWLKNPTSKNADKVLDAIKRS